MKENIITAFPHKKILVAGDVMLDEYIWGEVNRISPEAPVPVVEIRTRSHALGGAANVAANVVSLGGRALLTGLVGNDLNADALRALVGRIDIDPGGLIVDKTRPTTNKTRIIAHSQQVVRIDSEKGSEVGGRLGKEIVDWAEKRVPDCDACVISDYHKGAVSAVVAQGVIQAAKKHGKPVVVDPKGVDYRKYRGATVVTPNVREAEAVLQRDIKSKRDLLRVAQSLGDLLEASAVIITRGAEGMTVYDEQGKIGHIPAVARTAYDVTGAGDTVVATLALSLASGVSLSRAAKLANRAAGLVVEKVGTATVSAGELLDDAGQ